MLETVTQGFHAATEKLRGVKELNEDNIAAALRDVRTSLLEADVDFDVVQDFLAGVKQGCLGHKVETRTRDSSGRRVRSAPGQQFVKICEKELVALMGPVDPGLEKARGATSIMLIGLQGVGKTTVAAKLARHLEKQKIRPLLVAADIYRPAAIDQLETLGESIGIPVHRGREGQSPSEICRAAADRARDERLNGIIYDTAGRLAVDDGLMTELEQIVASVEPANTLLVCDSLMGRDAVNVARAFKQRIDIDGIVMTKLDGDARGGAALAVKAATGVPIKFLGTGETVDKLEEFRPEGLASRILGMGDIVGLVQDFEEVVDEKQAEADAERLLKGQFTLDDLVTQLKTISKMGSLKEVLGKLPGMGSMAEQVDETELGRVQSLIHSMTPQERREPDLIDKSRAQRIAGGSGRQPKEVHQLVERFDQMKALLSAMGGSGGKGLLGGGMPSLPGMGGGFAAAGDGDPMAMFAAPESGGRARGRERARNTDNRKKSKRKQARKARRRGRR
ncbi:MAG: signal recognition particle protein [Myxococcota bacterium]|nr:signal recognition particle protein [Myxococcota bacterium]